jgi:signal peptidase I
MLFRRTKSENTHPKPKPTRAQRLKDFLVSLVLILAVMLPVRSSIADWCDVPTGSMEPTILVGDRIFVNRLAYGLRVPFTHAWLVRWDSPDRGEVVIFASPTDGTRLVKRIIGLPGDTIELKNNALAINGTPVNYGTLDQDTIDQIDTLRQPALRFAAEQLGAHNHAVMATPAIPAQRAFDPITVPAGCYFVMGDNRDNSRDSRSFGFVPEDTIVGRSSAVVLSVDKSRWYAPRLSRFFHGIP